MDVRLWDGMDVLKDVMLVIKEFQKAPFVSDIEQILESSVVFYNQFEDEQKRAIERLTTTHYRTKRAQTHALQLASTIYGLVDYTKRRFQRKGYDAGQVSILFAETVLRKIVPDIKKVKDTIGVAIICYTDIPEDISCLLSWCDSKAKTDNNLASNPEEVRKVSTSTSIGLVAAAVSASFLTGGSGSALALGAVAGAAITLANSDQQRQKRRRLMNYEDYQQMFKENLKILQGHHTESNILSKILKCIELAEEKLCSGNARLSNKMNHTDKDLNGMMKQTCDHWKEIDRLCF